MFLNIWENFIKRKTFSYFLLFVVILFGIYSMLSLPRESTPEVQVPIAIISTSYFGATASVVESQVTDEIEKAVEKVAGISKINSTSSNGFSSIVVQFNQSEDIDEKVNEVKDEIDKIKPSLPNDANDVLVSDFNFSDQPVYIFSLSSNLNLFAFKEIVDDLKDKLEDVSAVSTVSISGMPELEISVLLDQKKLAKHKVSFEEVSAKLNSASLNIPGGSLEISKTEYPININSEIKDIEDLKNLPIKKSGNTVIYLKDLARIEKIFQETLTESKTKTLESDWNKSVTISISKKQGSNLEEFTGRLNQELLNLQEEGLLAGTSSNISFDAGKYVKQDISNLSQNGLTAIFLVFIAILFILGFKDSFVAAIGIPISFILAFIAFYLVGNTINFISLFSMILSIGILVDSDIVITEGIAARKAKGMGEFEAARAAVRELAGPMIAGTMTTVAVFLPLFFLSGVTGDFISSIPFTVVFILLASQIVSIFVVPLMHSTKFKSKLWLKIKNRNKKNLKFSFDKIQKRYGKVLNYFLEKRYRRVTFVWSILIFFFFTLSLLISGVVKSEFFPGGDVEIMYVEIEMPEGTQKDSTLLYLSEVEEILEEKNYYTSLVSTFGRNSDFSQKPAFGDNRANVLVNFSDEEKPNSRQHLSELKKELSDKELYRALAKAQEDGPPGGAPIDISISSENIEGAKTGVLLVEKILKNIDGVEDIKSNLEKNSIGYEIDINREKAEFYGINIASISNFIRSSTEGIEVFEIKNKNDETKVILKNNLRSENDALTFDNISSDDLKNIQLTNAFGQKIFLSEIIDIRIKQTNSNIYHLDREVIFAITAETSEDTNLTEAIEELRTQFEEQNKNPKTKLVFGGEFQDQQQSQTEMMISLLVGVFLIFGILIFVFNSIRLPLIIESVIPMAFSGVVMGLLFSGNALSFPAMLGFIALTGIVVNNSIILIYVFENLKKEKPDTDIKDIVTEGAKSRLRPIMLTTLTTIIGVAPLIFASAMWSPIAYTLIFGLTFATVITLLFIPIIYLRKDLEDSSFKRLYKFIKRKVFRKK